MRFFIFSEISKRGSKEFYAIKVDMKKAYDGVEWDFVERLLIEMGFGRTWTRWIMGCIRGVSFRLLNNGKRSSLTVPS